MSVENKNQIIQIATDVSGEYDIYAVKGKAIVIKNHVLDLDNPLNVSRILSLSDDLFDRDKFLPPVYGNATMAIVVSMEERECAVAMGCMSDLPDDVAEGLKAAMDRQEKMRAAAVERIKRENRIVEIAADVSGKYDIYVVNGKPIGIKHHVWNMDNPEQLDNIVGIAKDLFCVPDMRAIYGEDTICILTHSGGEYCGGEYCRAALGIHDMSGLPEDVVRKVKAAMVEYARNQIADIDGYAHVVGGKVICFKPDVYDLNKLRDVQELIAFADAVDPTCWSELV